MATESRTPPKRSALGKGIGALLGDVGMEPDIDVDPPEVKASPSDVVAQVRELPIEQVIANAEQPRKVFDEQAISELSESIKKDGVLQPIIVRAAPEQGKYIIIAGERRWRASKKAECKVIPAIIKESVGDASALRLALIENIQRADLNIIEEAEAYAALIRDYGYTQEQCAEQVGKDRSTVSNTLRLLSLPRVVQDDLLEDKLSMGHGRALLSLETQDEIAKARDHIVEESLSVRQTESYIRALKQGDAPKKVSEPAPEKEDEVDPNLEYLMSGLRDHLHTKVKVSGTGQKGRITISYFSEDELNRLLKLMGYSLD